MARFMIRTIEAPALYLGGRRYAKWVDSPGDARVFDRKCDAKNCPSWDPETMEVIGAVVVTQSEWDLLEDSLPKEGFELVSSKWALKAGEAQDHLAYLRAAGVDNWDGYRSLDGFRDDDEAEAVYP